MKMVVSEANKAHPHEGPNLSTEFAVEVLS